MALTTVVSGAQVLANDADQFRQLLTGAMTDQAVTIANSTVLGGASVGHEARLGPTIYGDATRLIVGWSQRLNHAHVLLGRNLTGTTGSDSYTTPSAQANVGYAGIELTDTGPINVYVQTGTMTAGGTIVSPNLVATFGAAAVTMAQPVLVPLGSAAAPSSTFNGDTNTGVYSPGADQWAVATGGVQRVLVDASGNVGIGTAPIVVGTTNRLSVQLPSANGNLIAYLSKIQATNDTGGYITFGGGGTGTVARGYIGLTSTGTSGPTLFSTGEAVDSLGILAVGALQFGVNNAGVAWQMTSAGHFVAGVDNAYDIGASGANRPRALYLIGDITMDGIAGTSRALSIARSNGSGVQGNNGSALTIQAGGAAPGALNATGGVLYLRPGVSTGNGGGKISIAIPTGASGTADGVFSTVMTITYNLIDLFGGGVDNGGGSGVIRIGNAITVPTTNPAGGGLMYADAGAGKWRGSSGTITTFGPAEPHCPTCGRDFIVEWQNPAYGHLAVCMWCLTEGLPAGAFIRSTVVKAKR